MKTENVLAKIEPRELPCNWFLIYTYPNSERKIQKLLERNEIECFLPLKKIVKQWSDRKKTLEVPIFPNYIFIHISIYDRYKILDFPGVVRYVTFNGRPSTISEDVINSIKIIISGQEITIEEDFIEGDFVKISDGPFEGLSGLLFKKKGKTRFGVSVDALNQIVSIEMDVQSLTRMQLSLV